MVRAASHLKEAIACRTFEHALDAHLVAHPTRQGADYGIDYLVNVFDDAGELARTFAAQIKYVDPKDVERPNLSWREVSELSVITAFGFGGPHVVRLQVPKQRLREYLDRERTPAEALLVAANDRQFFSVWLSDLHRYWLQWLTPNVLLGDGTLTLLLNSVRGQWRKRQSFAHPDADDAPETLLLREIDGERGGWFDASRARGTIESIANVAVTAYLQAKDARAMRGKTVDVDGLWNLLLADERPIVPLLFGRTLATLEATESMSRWALNAAREWRDIFAIPLAFHILAASPHVDDVSAALDILQKLDPLAQYWSAYFHLQMDAGYYGEFSYLDFEFASAIAAFLTAAVRRHRSESAQSVLVRAFANHVYSVQPPNLYAFRLAELAREQLLLDGESLQRLRKLCGVEDSIAGDALAKAIEQTNSRWHREYEEER